MAQDMLQSSSGLGTLNAFLHKSSLRWGAEAQPPSLAQGNSQGWAGGGAGIWAVPMAASEKPGSRDGGGVQGPQRLGEWLVSMATAEQPPG